MTKIVASALALVLALSACSKTETKTDAPAATAAAKATPVRVATSVLRDTPVQIESMGTVEPLNQVVVRSRVDGQVLQVRFREGIDVRQGDVLVELDPRPLRAQVDSAMAQQQRDQVQLDSARVQLDRAKVLSQSGMIANQALDQAKLLVDQTLAAVGNDTALVSAARLQLDFATIRAPISGRAGARLVRRRQRRACQRRHRSAHAGPDPSGAHRLRRAAGAGG